MNAQHSTAPVNLGVVVTVILFNLLLVVMFWARVGGQPAVARNAALVDLGVVVTVNLFNVLLAVMFWARVADQPEVARLSGIGTLALGVPLAAYAILNLAWGRPWWTYVLPLLLVLFLLIELVFDYILHIEFRHSWLVGPYLFFYYAGSMVMVGYAFLVAVPYGVVTLITYFIQVGLGVYARFKTGL